MVKSESTVTLTDELGIYKDPEGVASCFIKFFSTIGNKLSQCFSIQALPSNNPYNNISPTFNFKPITHDCTSKQLLSFDLGLDRKFKKVTHAIAKELSCSQGTLTVSKFESSKRSKILMWRILLSSYNLIQAIYEEVLHSQGPSCLKV